MNFFHFFQKIVLFFFIFIFTCSYVFADDLSPAEDDFDISEILGDIESTETSSDNLEIPTINSRAYVVIDRKSNTILVGKNENQKKKMASTTKIMTAMVTLDICKQIGVGLDQTVTIPKEAAGVEGSSLYLKEGEEETLKAELLLQ